MPKKVPEGMQAQNCTNLTSLNLQIALKCYPEYQLVESNKIYCYHKEDIFKFVVHNLEV